MCNLYSLNKGQDHIRREFRVNWDDTGNIPPLPGIFPDVMAPVVRNDGDGRRMQMMRWCMPTPPKFLTAGAIDRGGTAAGADQEISGTRALPSSSILPKSKKVNSNLKVYVPEIVTKSTPSVVSRLAVKVGASRLTSA